MATKYTVQRRLGRNGWEDITAHMSKKAAEKAVKTIRDTRKRIGLDDGKFQIEYQIWPALPEQKEKAVELWWAIKNVGALARDEPRFAELELGVPALFATKREAEKWRRMAAWRLSGTETVRVEVREL